MENVKGLIGSKHGKLTVIKYIGFSESSQEHYYRVKCDCGKYTEIAKGLLDTVTDCGCTSKVQAKLQRELERLGKIEYMLRDMRKSDGITYIMTLTKMKEEQAEEVYSKWRYSYTRSLHKGKFDIGKYLIDYKKGLI